MCLYLASHNSFDHLREKVISSKKCFIERKLQNLTAGLLSLKERFCQKKKRKDNSLVYRSRKWATTNIRILQFISGSRLHTNGHDPDWFRRIHVPENSWWLTCHFYIWIVCFQYMSFLPNQLVLHQDLLFPCCMWFLPL